MTEILVFQLTDQEVRPLEISADSLDGVTSQLPSGLYTTFCTCCGGRKVLGLQAHYERLYGPAEAQSIQADVPRCALGGILSRLTSQNAPGESRLRLVLSISGSPGAVYAAIQPFSPLPPKLSIEGVRVKTYSMVREDPHLKCTAFIEASQDIRRQVRQDGDVFEMLLVQDGCILEGMTSNFYAVIGGVLTTAEAGILPGVTRRTILNLAREDEIEIDYRPVCIGEAIDEAFITSSSRGVVPVVMIDEQPIGGGVPGETTRILARGYEQYVALHAEWLGGQPA
ncbi:MAG: aminotransferase class IV family protein [Anaerolineales bacterium]|nr:aminotransferase class IV family protein [Anaerolineales bacterium]